VPIPDLISAATAQISDLVVLHYDADFELISKVTGQAHEGSLSGALSGRTRLLLNQW